MSYRFVIWSEVYHKEIYSSGCLAETLQARDRYGCLYPNEKIVMIERKEKNEDLSRRLAADLIQIRGSAQTLMNEIEILRTEDLYGFTVRQYL